MSSLNMPGLGYFGLPGLRRRTTANCEKFLKRWTRLSDFTFTFIHWRRKWQPTPVFLPGESQGWRNLVGYSPWVAQNWTRLSDFTSFISLTSYFITGEGNGNPLQYSCLENPMDRGAWWAMVHGVAESQTRLR